MLFIWIEMLPTPCAKKSICGSKEGGLYVGITHLLYPYIQINILNAIKLVRINRVPYFNENG